MIDFTACFVNKFKGYGGANGNKIVTVQYLTSYDVKIHEKSPAAMGFLHS